MNTLQEFKELIESSLDIKDCLEIKGGKLIPNVTRKFIRDTCSDDLFLIYHNNACFTNRFLSFVSEMTDRQLLCGHYFLELRNK